MEKLFDHSIVNVARVRERLEITPPGANNRVNRLVEIGLLREITGYKRNRRFRFDPYLRHFEKPGEESDDQENSHEHPAKTAARGGEAG